MLVGWIASTGCNFSINAKNKASTGLAGGTTWQAPNYQERDFELSAKPNFIVFSDLRYSAATAESLNATMDTITARYSDAIPIVLGGFTETNLPSEIQGVNTLLSRFPVYEFSLGAGDPIDQGASSLSGKICAARMREPFPLVVGNTCQGMDARGRYDFSVGFRGDLTWGTHAAPLVIDARPLTATGNPTFISSANGFADGPSQLQWACTQTYKSWFHHAASMGLPLPALAVGTRRNMPLFLAADPFTNDERDFEPTARGPIKTFIRNHPGVKIVFTRLLFKDSSGASSPYGPPVAINVMGKTVYQVHVPMLQPKANSGHYPAFLAVYFGRSKTVIRYIDPTKPDQPSEQAYTIEHPVDDTAKWFASGSTPGAYPLCCSMDQHIRANSGVSPSVTYNSLIGSAFPGACGTINAVSN